MDQSQMLQQQLTEAIKSKKALAIAGGHSKDFYGRQITGEEFSVAEHTGVVEYDFRELVITARAGTTLKALNEVLSGDGQMLPFEPPAFSQNATLGGTLACGLSGPARPYAGSARDLLLGTVILNGKAQMLSFGGQVMKNVAGYDLSRLMVGAMGTLGVLLQASLKVLPKPECEMTIVQEKSASQALDIMNRLAAKNIPLSAASFLDNSMYLRISSVEASVKKVVATLGGEVLEDSPVFWHKLKEQQHEFFNTDKTLWRFSLPPATPELNLQGSTCYDWGGGQRWFVSAAQSDQDNANIIQAVNQAGGHATQFRRGDRQAEVFQPLPQALLKIHQQLKNTMDPSGIFNPGRLYSSF